MMFYILILIVGVLPFLNLYLWKKEKFFYIIIINCICLCFGEFGRIDVVGITIKIFDLSIYISVLTYFLNTLFIRKKIKISKNFILLIPFIIIAILSLFLQYDKLDFVEFIVSSMYIGRFILFSFILIIGFNEKIEDKKLLTSIHILSYILMFVGVLQLIFLYNMTYLAQYGWDPHIGRIVSSFLDPNYFGGFMAILFFIYLNYFFCIKKNKEKYFVLFTMSCILLTIIFTYSRSAYITFLIGSFITFIRKYPKAILVFSILIIFSLFISRVSSRVFDMVESGLAIIKPTYENILDPTSAKRVESWQMGYEFFEKQPIFGIGFNTIKYYKHNFAYVLSADEHSASGFDSSVLVAFVTTGLIGGIFYIMFWIGNFFIIFTKKNKDFLDESLISIFFAMAIHSLFVNSLFLPYFMFIIFLILGKQSIKINE